MWEEMKYVCLFFECIWYCYFVLINYKNLGIGCIMVYYYIFIVFVWLLFGVCVLGILLCFF